MTYSIPDFVSRNTINFQQLFQRLPQKWTTNTKHVCPKFKPQIRRALASSPPDAPNRVKSRASEIAPIRGAHWHPPRGLGEWRRCRARHVRSARASDAATLSAARSGHLRERAARIVARSGCPAAARHGAAAATPVPAPARQTTRAQSQTTRARVRGSIYAAEKSSQIKLS